MNQMKFIYAALFLITVMSQPVTAAASNCSYSKSLERKGIGFDVRSRPASGCAVQIITVTVWRGGKKITGMKADVDYLARSARAVDLTGDGKPELAIISRTTGGVLTEALDVYWLDGTTLRRTMAPELDDKGGYKGGDRFNLKGRQIVRVIPVYRDGDPIGKPTGGTRSLEYEFKDGALTPVVQAVKAASPSDGLKVQDAVQPVQPTQPPVEAKPAVPAASVLAVNEVKAVKAGIEISSCGPIEKFKVEKLETPERIVIDIPDADSSLAGRRILINRFGITTARVGRNKGFLRVVLDTTRKKFPKYEVKSSAGGILVEFTK